MKKLIILVTLASLLVAGCTQTTDYYSCTQDSDCVKVSGGCCDCNNGGNATAISKKELDLWTSQITSECENIMCATVISDDPSCFQEPRCVNNKCVLQ